MAVSRFTLVESLTELAAVSAAGSVAASAVVLSEETLSDSLIGSVADSATESMTSLVAVLVVISLIGSATSSATGPVVVMSAESLTDFVAGPAVSGRSPAASSIGRPESKMILIVTIGPLRSIH